MEVMADMLRAPHSAVSAVILTEVAAPLQETNLCMLARELQSDRVVVDGSKGIVVVGALLTVDASPPGRWPSAPVSNCV